MYNPIELVYMVIFSIYKFLSTKSRTLETLWYRLDNDCFKPEIIRITKHHIFGVSAMTLIDNKTLGEREYLFRWLSYQEVVDTYKLYSLRTMMVYIKDINIKRLVQHDTLDNHTLSVHVLAPEYKNTQFHFMKIVKDIKEGDCSGIIKMNMFYGYRKNRLCILGIPTDILMMLDVDMVIFNKAIHEYIKQYHSMSYQLLSSLKK